MADLKKQLTPAFLAAVKNTPVSGHVETILRITEEIRQTILIPASKNLDQIRINRKENLDMRSDDAKTISIETDRDCETRLEHRLREAYPDALIIGEEMFGDLSSADKQEILNRALAEKDRMVILTDALDGTRDFCNGGDGFSVLVTLIQNGETIASVVHRCTDHADPDGLGHTLTYEQGDGVRINGKKLRALSSRDFSDDGKMLRGYAHFEFIAAKHGKAAANDNKFPDLAAKFDSLSDLWTCGKMYDDLITGRHHFMLIAPPADMFDYPSGIALVTQAGGTARFLDGTPATFAEMVKRQSFVRAEERAFDIRDTLVLAVSDAVFQTVQNTILPPNRLPKPVKMPAKLPLRRR